MQKACVLIVDDRPDGLFSIEAVLHASDIAFDVVTASSGPEAIELVKTREFAVILLDVQMPGMDGFETARRIRRMSRHVPIIFITAISRDDLHVFKGYDSGAVDYLFKPLNNRVLQSKVNVFVDLYNKTQALQEQAALLREHEKREHDFRYQNLADAMPHLVFKTDADGAAYYFNSGWFTYTGLTENASTGREWESVISSMDLIRFLKTWKDWRPEEPNFEVEVRIRRGADHVDKWHLVRGVPEKTRGGELTGWLFSCTDVQELKDALANLEERTRDLERSNNDLEQFAYVASHDLQEPLRKITSYIDLLRMYTKGNLDEKSEKCLTPIVDGAARMQQLIKGLLNYSRVGKEDLETAGLLDLRSEVLEVVQSIPSTREADIAVNNLPKVKADSFRIRQLFQNLITNALKFRSVERPLVQVGAEKKGDKWVFFVKDNGIGIPAAHQHKIFVIFQRLHSNQKYPGTGIGLAICKRIVEAYGGKIWVDSKPSSGTTFYFTLPDAIEEQAVAVG